MPGMIHSKAQMRLLFAKEGRGELPGGKAEEMARAEGPRRLAHLPEHVERAFLGHLIRKYFGGRMPRGSFEYEHDERRGDFEEPDGYEHEADYARGGEACQHYAHGGVSDRHDPGCPGHHMYGGGYADPEDEDESEGSFEAEERRESGLRPAGELRGLARGGQPRLGSGKRFEHLERSIAARKDGARDPGAVAAAIGREKYGAHKMAKLAAAHRAHGGYAQGGEAEEAEMHLEGDGWQDDERNRPRSPLAARLSGARVGSGALRRLLRRPATRVP